MRSAGTVRRPIRPASSQWVSPPRHAVGAGRYRALDTRESGRSARNCRWPRSGPGGTRSPCKRRRPAGFPLPRERHGRAEDSAEPPRAIRCRGGQIGQADGGFPHPDGRRSPHPHSRRRPDVQRVTARPQPDRYCRRSAWRASWPRQPAGPPRQDAGKSGGRCSPPRSRCSQVGRSLVGPADPRR